MTATTFWPHSLTWGPRFMSRLQSERHQMVFSKGSLDTQWQWPLSVKDEPRSCLPLTAPGRGCPAPSTPAGVCRSGSHRSYRNIFPCWMLRRRGDRCKPAPCLALPGVPSALLPFGRLAIRNKTCSSPAAGRSPPGWAAQSISLGNFAINNTPANFCLSFT